MGKIYTGRFLSQKEVEYVVNIYRKEVDVKKPGDLVFGEVPAEIEWSEVDKMEPVQGSALTLTLLSTTDRQYVDLYTVETGEVWAEVLRGGKLYWTGTLDTELYEEPYSYKQDYEVQFTFSDFGTLERMKWSDRSVRTLKWIISECLTACDMSYNDVNLRMSTTGSALTGTTDVLGQCSVNCENFFDEDDEPMTMRKVLEAVLQPFALRAVQKGGKVELYDLNALYADTGTQQVEWMSDDATLSVDKVYNDVTVKFSPYASTEMIDGTIEHDDTIQDTEGVIYRYDTTKGLSTSEEIQGFRFATRAADDGDDLPVTLGEGVYLYRIDPEYSGNEEAGFAYGWRGQEILNSSTGNYNKQMGTGFPILETVDGNPYMYLVKPIITTRRAFINSPTFREKFKLKIELDVLFDVRYNPFEAAAAENEEGNYKRLKDWANYGYVPIKLQIYDADGGVKCHYQNKTVVMSSGYKNTGTWVSGEAAWGDAWLAYYDREDRKASTGFGGWTTNKQTIGWYSGELPKIMEKRGDGEYIVMPSAGNDGWIELQVGKGLYIFDNDKRSVEHRQDIADRARWLLYKAPKVTVVKYTGTTIDTEDREDYAWLNKAAQEEYSIDTTVGTPDDTNMLPTARGVLLDSSMMCVKTLTRGGVTDRIERLLIGTIYSQYAERKTTLSGTTSLLTQLRPLTDASTDGRFTLLSEIQHLQEDLSEIKMAEFDADNYEAVEFK